MRNNSKQNFVGGCHDEPCSSVRGTLYIFNKHATIFSLILMIFLEKEKALGEFVDPQIKFPANHNQGRGWLVTGTCFLCMNTGPIGQTNQSRRSLLCLL